MTRSKSKCRRKRTEERIIKTFKSPYSTSFNGYEGDGSGGIREANNLRGRRALCLLLRPCIGMLNFPCLRVRMYVYTCLYLCDQQYHAPHPHVKTPLPHLLHPFQPASLFHPPQQTYAHARTMSSRAIDHHLLYGCVIEFW